MRNGISRWVLGAGLMAFVPAWAGDVLSVAAFGEVRSSYLTRGAVVNKDPAAILWTKARVNLPYGAYAGIWTWSVSAFSDSGQTAKRRYAFHENDFVPEWGFVWTPVDRWHLDSTFSYRYVDLQGYDVNDDPRHEFCFGQTLTNPYVTPYYLLRYAVHPMHWGYCNAGIRRKFALTEYLSFTPQFFGDFGNGHHFASRYWMKGHGCALQALNVKVTLDYAVNANLGVYVGFHELVIVDGRTRRALRQSSRVESLVDRAVFSVGLRANF